MAVVPTAPPSREGAQQKAWRYVCAGRLTVTRLVPGCVEATCKGDGVVYRLGWERGAFWCDCPSWSASCSHLIALRLVVAVDL